MPVDLCRRQPKRSKSYFWLLFSGAPLLSQGAFVLLDAPICEGNGRIVLAEAMI